MDEQEKQNLFAELTIRHQSELYGYVYAVVRNWEDTDDIYQAVCLVLWRKFDSFRQGSSFISWARQVAKIEINNFLRHKPLPTYLPDNLIEILPEIAAESHDADPEDYLGILQQCRDKLTASDRELLRLCYGEDLSTVEIAGRLQRLQQSVSRSLNRIRRWLLECVQMKLAKTRHPSKGNF